MNMHQAGIFAPGTSSHEYLEFDLLDERRGAKLVAAISTLREPRTTIGGVNLVVGFRPELWSQVAPDHAPAGVHGFNTRLVGPDGFGIPATQHDAVLWLSGSAYDVLFDVAREAIVAVKELASVADETSSWAYRHDRDLTGFIDGSENPGPIDAADAALISEGQAGEGGSVLLLQKWKHDTTAWESLPVDRQERIMGRRKLDSVELDDKLPDSHVASTDQDRFGKIFRRNMPYGTVTDHGTMFVGFSADQRRLSTMLESMAGVRTGVRDALTRYTRPISSAYYFVPSTESLRRSRQTTSSPADRSDSG
jgi:putative iron-dependent peroxidase